MDLHGHLPGVQETEVVTARRGEVRGQTYGRESADGRIGVRTAMVEKCSQGGRAITHRGRENAEVG